MNMSAPKLSRPACALLGLAALSLTAALCVTAAQAQTLTITGGGTYSGTYVGTSSQAAITVNTNQPVLITNCTLSGPGDLIYAGSGSNVTVTYTTGTGAGASSTSTGSFLSTNQPASVNVHNCDMINNAFGVQVNGYSGNYTAANSISIDWNRIRNINGANITFNLPHAIQLSHAAGIPGIEIAHNEIINAPYVSDVNDVINLYSSGGTAGSHAVVHDNFIQGLFSSNPTEANSGVGIICDGWQHDSAASATQFVDIYGNVCTQMSNAGVAIDSGHDNHAYNNTIISAGILPDGTVYADTYGNGIDEYNPADGSGYPQPAGVYYGNSVYGNLIGFMRGSGSGGTARADDYLPSDSGSDPYGSNSYLDHNPAAADEEAQARTWAQTLANNGWWVGDNLVLDPGFEAQLGSYPNGTLGGRWRADAGGGGTAGTDIDQPGNPNTGHIEAWVHNPSGTYGAYAAQDGIGVQPNTTYTLSAFCWDVSNGAVGGGGAEIGAWSDDWSRNIGDLRFTPSTSGYAPAAVSFTTGPNDTRIHIEIGISGQTSDSWMRIDDVKLSDPTANPPPAPSRLKAVAGPAGTRNITLTWNKVSGAAGYKVYRTASRGGAYSKIGTASGTSYVSTGLMAGLTYYYKAAAFNAAGVGPQSSAVSAKAR